MDMDATVPVGDLELALDYLEGLVLILTEFADRAEAGISESVSSELYVALQGALRHDAESWAPLRYGGARGWQAVAAGVANLRERLLAAYPDAAL